MDKPPITEKQFEGVCQIIETTEFGTDRACAQCRISPTSFRQYMRILGEPAELRYARAKSCQVEIILDKISLLHDKCLDEIRNINDPKRCNAIQSAYREQIRHCEWIASKLKATKYGDKIDVTTNGQSLSREINVVSTVNKKK
jgi:hypothetical protein